jgi:tRNA-dihydrouridine synthase 3
MALATNLLQGQPSEWALLKRHPSEDCFGVQLCGGFPDSMARCAQLIEDRCSVDFVDVNFGCPIDVVCGKGAGSACLLKPQRLEAIVRSMSSVLSCPLTFKMRKGYHDGQDIAHTLVPQAAGWGAAAVTLHGRTREQRYSRWGGAAAANQRGPPVPCSYSPPCPKPTEKRGAAAYDAG